MVSLIMNECDCVFKLTSGYNESLNRISMVSTCSVTNCFMISELFYRVYRAAYLYSCSMIPVYFVHIFHLANGLHLNIKILHYSVQALPMWCSYYPYYIAVVHLWMHVCKYVINVQPS